MSRLRQKVQHTLLQTIPKLEYPGFNFPAPTPRKVWSNVRYMNDSINSLPYPDTNLTLDVYTMGQAACSGRTKSGPFTQVWDGVQPPDYVDALSAPAITPTHDINAQMTKALANINPNNPIVDVPLLLFELKDFPRMLRGLGDILGRNSERLSHAPDAVLAYNFGWKPLISDLHKLVDSAESMERRKQYLNELKKGTVVNRTLDKRDYKAPATEYRIGDSIFKRQVRYTHKSWFSTRVQVSKPIKSFSSGDLSFDQARNALGLNASASTIWNAIPWSWLIDYLGNVGDMLNARRGNIQYDTISMCLMNNYNSSYQLTPIYQGAVRLNGSPATLERKFRTVIANPTPLPAFQPFLTNGQILNLGSLATAKALKSLKL